MGLADRNPRERMVRSAAVLIREHGLARTGMREIAEAASAPRGSLQHYFPGGKDQLVSEAIDWIATQVTKPFEAEGTGAADGADGAGAADGADGADGADDVAARPTPARQVVADMFERWRQVLESTDYLAGCALVSTISDAVANDPLRAKAAEAFAAWRNALAAALRRGGVPHERSERLATTAIAAMEGAMVLARAERDIAPYDAVARELTALIDAAAG